MQKRTFCPETKQITSNMSSFAPKHLYFFSDLIKYSYLVAVLLHYPYHTCPKPAHKWHFSKYTKHLKISLFADNITP
ncbi:hypothetical protein M23134_03957 [Microscilla marina ATCC 23134]|uniref:Uncharacterized protein n=1 Tax=Microscilla marina ATCC 23134 TaxID=313606 RepID=A1ZMM5_MICM2|nr:hypothetical protein M23134_03957 [Microscilla marina ATCC 23134]